jgi:hypothetical protein
MLRHPDLEDGMPTGDDQMIGPGAHDNAASEALVNGRTEDAKVLALLALASPVNRLAAAQEDIANA